jgi:hypothetical protein
VDRETAGFRPTRKLEVDVLRPVGHLDIVELDPEAFFPENHPKYQKDQQQRRTQPGRDHTRQDADQEDQANEQDQLIGDCHGVPTSSPLSAPGQAMMDSSPWPHRII